MTDLETQLVKYIEDAHAVEQHMLRALEIGTTNDTEMRTHLEHLEIASYQLLASELAATGATRTA